ncbi:hypothetical protein BH23GEM2_BH23GEM2_09810 [soil metagenome]
MTAELLIKRGLLFFWAAYFTVVLASNVTDGLKAMAVVPDGFRFVSGNYALVERVTRIYAVPAAGVALLYVGVLLWQAATAGLFWRAFGAWRGGTAPDARIVNTAFAAGLGLWAAFILVDELFIAYEIAGLEATHVALLSAQLLSLLVYSAKLSRRAREPLTRE